MVAAEYLVTEFGLVERGFKTEYQPDGPPAEMWKVRFEHGTYANTSIDFFYKDEADARRFTKWSVYNPAQILAQPIAGGDAFKVNAIGKVKAPGVKNVYTGRQDTGEKWTASLEASNGIQMDFSYPTETQARARFSIGQTTSLQDLLGTTEMVPSPIKDPVREAAATALQAEVEAEQAETAKEQAAYISAQNVYLFEVSKLAVAQQSAATASVSAANALIPATQARANAVAAQTNLDGLLRQASFYPGSVSQSAISAAIVARDAADNMADSLESVYHAYASQVNAFQADAAAKIAVKNAAALKAAALGKLFSERTIPTYANEYLIVQGGASGYYNGVFYKSGTFASPRDGKFVGTFKSVPTVYAAPAGSGMIGGSTPGSGSTGLGGHGTLGS